MLSVFTPEELNDEMSQFGFVEIETIPSEEQKRRYLKDRSDWSILHQISPSRCSGCSSKAEVENMEDLDVQ